MNSILLILLFGLSIVLACHESCNCNPGSKVCISCKVPGSQMDAYQRSCPCPDGYYTSSFTPFLCTQLVGYNPDGSNISVVMKSCFLEMGMKTKYIDVQSLCSYSVVNNISYVKVNIVFNMDNMSINSDCIGLYKYTISYLDPTSTNYIPLPLPYIKDVTDVSKIIAIPLNNLNTMSQQTVTSDQEISQTINLQISIGNEEGDLRDHKISLVVYTNRGLTNVFTFDVDSQDVFGCIQSGQCITVTDVDTTSSICSDQTCATPLNHAQYKVGDTFYASIQFADSTQTKQLQFNSLLFKDDTNKILDFTQITKSQWVNNSLYISFPMVIPSIKGIVQIKMAISNLKQLRFLQSSDGNVSQVQFQTTTVTGKVTLDQVQNASVVQDKGVQQIINLSIQLTFQIIYFVFIISLF